MNRVWIDGQLREVAAANVNALDAGPQSGLGVFESMAVVRGAAFARTRHLARLRNSAEVIGVELPDEAQLRDALDLVISENPSVTRIRITVIAGPGVDSKPTTVVHGAVQPPWAWVAHAVTSRWVRNERGALAGVKATSYAENLVARRAAVAAGADEALLFDTHGYLSEGTASNVFIECDGRLSTPSPANGCLGGVTAELVTELVDVNVRADLDADHLAGCREAFLTSSTRMVHPLATIDGQAIELVPGPLTKAAADAFADLVRRTDDP